MTMIKQETKWIKLHRLIDESVMDYKDLGLINNLLAEIELDHRDYRAQRGRNPDF